MNIHCMCTLFVGVSGCIIYCLHIYECCTVIYENYKLLLTLSSAMRFSNKGPSATFRYTKYTSKVNIESLCCKLMGFFVPICHQLLFKFFDMTGKEGQL